MHCSEKGFINAVSADEASVISVWNAETGELVIQFVARMRVLPDGTELPVAVTAMRFDGSLRRLVTGFNDGCVRTFNCNNGAILREVYSCLHCSYIELHPPVCLSVCLFHTGLHVQTGSRIKFVLGELVAYHAATRSKAQSQRPRSQDCLSYDDKKNPASKTTPPSP